MREYNLPLALIMTTSPPSKTSTSRPTRNCPAPCLRDLAAHRRQLTLILLGQLVGASGSRRLRFTGIPELFI
jgi:hypothetical protein